MIKSKIPNNSHPMPKLSFPFPLIPLLGVMLGALPNQAQAATISFSDPTPNGISYEWTVQISNNDTANFSSHVGAFSWNEPANPIGLKGWTHTSNWVALELTQPTRLTVKIDRTAGVPTATGIAGNTLYPAFSLFSGWQNNGTEDHQYNNIGNTAWANEITYFSHEDNSGGASSVVRQFVLPAGFYSLAIGGNPPANSPVRREGYTAILSSTPIPEPATNGMIAGVALLFLASGLRLSSVSIEN